MDLFLSWCTDVQLKFIQSFITENRWKLMLRGFGITVEVSILAAILGIAIGILVALAVMSKIKFLRGIANGYIDVIRGTPSVTQLMIIYYVIFAAAPWPKAITASIAFAINSGAYVAEIIRAGIQSIDIGQTEAGRSLGLSKAQTMIHIVIPQAIKNIFPALVNEFVVLIKETAIVGLIGLSDLNFSTKDIIGATYSAFMPLVGSAVVYFIFIKIVTKLLKTVENRLRKNDIR